MGLSGRVEMGRILTAVAIDPESAVGVELEANAGDITRILVWRRVGTQLIESKFQAVPEATNRIFTGFGSIYGVDLTNATQIKITAWFDRPVLIEVVFVTPEDLNTINWDNVLS